MLDKLLEFTCNTDACDNVQFDIGRLTGLYWISINEAGVNAQVCINKTKAEQLRDWLTKQLDNQP